MQVSNAVIIIAAELLVAVAITAVILFFYTRKLNSTIKKQQLLIKKINRELRISQQNAAIPSPQEIAPPPPALQRSYADYINEMIKATLEQHSLLAPEDNIESSQGEQHPLFQRILALRYAFLRAEQQSTTEKSGNNAYWGILQTALEPLLLQAPPPPVIDNRTESELEACKQENETLRVRLGDSKNKIEQLHQQLQEHNEHTQQAESKLIQLQQEITAAQELLVQKTLLLGNQQSAHTEIDSLKQLVQSLSQETEQLMTKYTTLQTEFSELEQRTQQPTTLSISSPGPDLYQFKKLQAEYKDLQNEFDDLEQKYLELKLNS